MQIKVDARQNAIRYARNHGKFRVEGGNAEFDQDVTVEGDLIVTGAISTSGDEEFATLSATVAVQSDTFQDEAGTTDLIAVDTNELEVRALSGGNIEFYSGATQVGALETDGDLILIRGAAAGVSRFEVKVASVTIDASASLTAANARVAGKFILGITGEITTTFAGGGVTSLSIGDGSDGDRYGVAIALTDGTTVDYSDATADPSEFLAAADDIVITGAGGTPTSGIMRVDVHYLDLVHP